MAGRGRYKGAGPGLCWAPSLEPSGGELRMTLSSIFEFTLWPGADGGTSRGVGRANSNVRGASRWLLLGVRTFRTGVRLVEVRLDLAQPGEVFGLDLGGLAVLAAD